MPDELTVEVAFALPGEQWLESLSLSPGACVQDAIDRSGIAQRFPKQPVESLPVGVWGRVVERDCRLLDGDRVEIYRPLAIDPRDTRRRLADQGRTMRAESGADAQSSGDSS